MAALQAWLTDVAAFWTLTWPPIIVWGNSSAARLDAYLPKRLRQTLDYVAMMYVEHPCAVPACPCVVHPLGLTQADDQDWELLRKPRK
jgi:hypothetical protein